MENVFGLPRKVPTRADVSGARDDLRSLEQSGVDVPIKPFIKSKGEVKQVISETWLTALSAAGITAPITPEVVAADAASTAIDEVAAPGGERREAFIIPVLDQFALGNVTGILAGLVATETKIIKVHLEENPTGASLSGPGAVNAW